MTSPGVTRPLCICLVENHPDTLRFLKLYLEQNGHQVHTAVTLEQALRLLAELDCDVLLSDIGLPDGDGWELMRQVSKPIYGIAMSGFGMNADREKSRAAGYRHHLLKPFMPEELDTLLAEAIQERG
ncbi:MAG: response regulator [Chthoniobacterales bacterium]